MNKTVLLVIVALLAINAAGTWMLVTQRNKIDLLAIGREKADVIEKYGSKILDEFNGNAAKAREEGARRSDEHQRELHKLFNPSLYQEKPDALAVQSTNKPPSKKPLAHDPNDPRWKFPPK